VGYTDANSTSIYLTFQASPSEALGNHQINCILSTGALVSAKYVQVLGNDPVSLHILDNNNSGKDVTNSTSTILIGTQISLSAQLAPQGTQTAANGQWTVSGCDPVGGFSVTATTGAITPLSTQGGSVVLYCTQGTGSTPMNVTYSVTLSSGETLTQQTSYVVTVPSFSVSVSQAPMPEVVFFERNVIFSNGPAPLPEMLYGNPHSGMSASYGPVSQAIPLTSGNYQWVQLVNLSTITQTDDPSDPDPEDTDSYTGLDTRYPAYTSTYFNDSPIQPFGEYLPNTNTFAGFKEVIRDDQFTLYLEFQPGSGSSNSNLFVPIWKVTWVWGGTATQNADGLTYTVVPHTFTPVTQGASAFGSSCALNFPCWSSVVNPQ
jgi:hypothetical protein